MNNTRRGFVFGASAALASLALPSMTSAMVLTPRQSAGPFYPTELPLDDDNDLVHVSGRDIPARGQATDLSGRLLDRNGRPLANTRIEIWQCDANGRYRHPHDPGRQTIDPGFQGFGHTTTDAEGRYRFLTIRPVPYPGRTPHIHVAVYPSGSEAFVTQLYVAGEAHNDVDFLYRRIPLEQRPMVTVEFARKAPAAAALQADWDIILGLSSG
jgi:protocatechuate 3,4-dioxygenase beta subunit